MNRSFQRLWISHILSTGGDAFGFVAMPLLVLDATQSVAQMGLVTAVGAVGQLTMGLLSGILVDRLGRGRLMIASDVARTILYGLLPLSWWLGSQSIGLIYFVSATGTALGNLFAVAGLASVIKIVGPDDIGLANSRLQGSQAVMYVLGSLAAGAMAACFGPAAAMAVNALSFAMSAICLITVGFGQDDVDVSRGQHRGIGEDFLTGMRYLCAHRGLRSLLLFQVAAGLLASAGLSAAIIDLIVYRLRVDLAQAPGGVGLCLGLAALGAIIGAALASRIRRTASFGTTAIDATAVQAAGLFLAGLGPGAGSVILGAMLWSAGLTLRGIAANTLRQLLTPNTVMGRVTASSLTLVYGAAALGAICITRFASSHGSSTALALTGAGLAVLALTGHLSPLRRIAKTDAS